MVLGEWLEASLGFLGPEGVFTAMFLIFLVDAAVFPALPEVFLVAFYFVLVDAQGWPPVSAAAALLVLAVAGDLCGNAALYGVVRRLRTRLPGFVERAMRRYLSLLLVSDERIILMNRVAPAVPLTGAFIAMCGWDLRRSLAFVALGGFAKYALLLALVIGLGLAFDPETARLVSFGAVIALLAASFAAARVRRRRMEARA